MVLLPSFLPDSSQNLIIHDLNLREKTPLFIPRQKGNGILAYLMNSKEPSFYWCLGAFGLFQHIWELRILLLLSLSFYFSSTKFIVNCKESNISKFLLLTQLFKEKLWYTERHFDILNILFLLCYLGIFKVNLLKYKSTTHFGLKLKSHFPRYQINIKVQVVNMIKAKS